MSGIPCSSIGSDACNQAMVDGPVCRELDRAFGECVIAQFGCKRGCAVCGGVHHSDGSHSRPDVVSARCPFTVMRK